MNKIDITNTKNHLVNKNENLLFSRHKLSEQALKIMNCLICMIKKDDKDFHEYVFYSKDFANLTNSRHKNIIEEMVKSSKELKSQNIKFELQNTVFETNMIISFEYEKSKGNYIKYMIHPKLKPFLLDLKNRYVSYDIKNILSLKSTYSIRLYELLKHKYNQLSQHSKNPFIAFEMDLEELVNMFQVPISYNLHKIKTHILDKSKSEFDLKTDIFFSYKLTKKCGKKFDTITFSICKNKKSF